MSKKELPPPLPPETRTVGQLVAETLKLYGDNLWTSLALGISLTLISQITAGRDDARPGSRPRGRRSADGGLLHRRLGDRRRRSAVRAGRGTRHRRRLDRLRPAAFLTLLFVLPAVAWLAFIGLVVPVLVIERPGIRAAFRRAIELARADYVHALGSLATLAILYELVRLMLVLLLRDLGDAGERAAIGLADLVLSPLLFLGGALLYVDQAARVRSSSAT